MQHVTFKRSGLDRMKGRQAEFSQNTGHSDITSITLDLSSVGRNKIKLQRKLCNTIIQQYCSPKQYLKRPIRALDSNYNEITIDIGRYS